MVSLTKQVNKKSIHRGVATFTLDTGKCPKWLFERMVKLGREMMYVMIAEFGADEFIKRIADPVWFQSLGTVLAFDWNASGLTTILTAALKEAIRGNERAMGVFICGGKGKTSRKTPEQITSWGHKLCLPDGEVNNLVYNSKMSAKVDSALIQDGFSLYHHAFFFSKNGSWAVIQQGMNKQKKSARRYHWYSKNINDLIVEPHTGVVSDPLLSHNMPLNLTAKNGESNRNLALQLVGGNYMNLMRDIQVLRRHSNSLSRMVSLRWKEKVSEQQLTLLDLAPVEFKTHPVMIEDFSRSKYLEKILWKLCDRQPSSYEKLVATEGVGPKTVRALALVSELIYGAKASYTDPARYSFAHGGKDGSPYPINRTRYDQTIEIMKRVVQKTRLDITQKKKAIQRLGGV